MDVPMCFQKEIIFNQDYITPPVAEAKKTPSLIHAILAFQGAAVQCVDNYEPLSFCSHEFFLSLLPNSSQPFGQRQLILTLREWQGKQKKANLKCSNFGLFSA